MFTKLFAHLSTMLFVLAGPRRTRVPARAANFIEYALLAVLAVVLFAVFNDSLQGALKDVFERVGTALGWDGTTAD